MEQRTQYYTVLIIRLFHFLLAGLTLISLIYESSNVANRIPKLEDIMQIFEGIVLMISIPTIIGHLLTQYRANGTGENLSIENVTLMNFNWFFGIISCSYNVLVLGEIIAFPECRDSYSYFNQSMKLTFGFLILLYLRIILKWRPDPDDRYFTISAILSGYLTFLSCSFIIGRHFARIIQMGFSKTINSNCSLINSSYRNFENILNKIDIFQVVFYLLSGIVIYFHLSNNLRNILKRQYKYKNWSNLTDNKEKEDEQLIPSNQEKVKYFYLKLFIKYNFIPIIIGIILMIIIICFYIPISGTNINDFGEYYKKYNTTKIIVQIFCVVLSIWQVINATHFEIEKNIRSKMENFILDLGTMAQIINATSHICNNLYKLFFNIKFHVVFFERYFVISIIANLLLIIQVICQRILFLEILQRKAENICLWKYDKPQQLKRFINPCIILGSVNFGLFIIDIVEYQLDVPNVYLDTFSNIINKLAVPFEVLHRLQGFTIFLYLIQQ